MVEVELSRPSRSSPQHTTWRPTLSSPSRSPLANPSQPLANPSQNLTPPTPRPNSCFVVLSPPPATTLRTSSRLFSQRRSCTLFNTILTSLCRYPRFRLSLFSSFLAVSLCFILSSFSSDHSLALHDLLCLQNYTLFLVHSTYILTYIVAYILAYIPSLCARARAITGTKSLPYLVMTHLNLLFCFCIFVAIVNYSDLIDFYLSSEFFFFFFSLDLLLSILV